MLKCFKKGVHTCARGGLGEGDAGGLPNEVLKDRADPERLIACGPRESLICGETGEYVCICNYSRQVVLRKQIKLYYYDLENVCLGLRVLLNLNSTIILVSCDLGPIQFFFKAGVTYVLGIRFLNAGKCAKSDDDLVL